MTAAPEIPEVSSVGETEETLKAKGRPYVESTSETFTPSAAKSDAYSQPATPPRLAGRAGADDHDVVV